MKYIQPTRFMFAAHPNTEQLYIIHSKFPLCIIAVIQTIPAKLFVIESEFYDQDEENTITPDETTILAGVLTDAAKWYRKNVIPKSN